MVLTVSPLLVSCVSPFRQVDAVVERVEREHLGASLCASVEGFTLHAALHVETEDREDFERLLEFFCAGERVYSSPSSHTRGL